MEIRHLEIFLEVSKLKSFSKAAESLHISQPTISRTVMELEEELGFQVFRRTNKEIRLTNEGEKLVIKASDIVNASEG